MPFPAFFVLAAALGARDHIRSKRTGRRMLDEEADRIDAINNIDLGIDVMGGANQFDAQQMEVMSRQFQTAQGMLSSKDPKLQSLGANMLADLDSAVRGNIQQNETEARADFVRQQDAEIVAAGLGRADNERRFEREVTMKKQLNDELKGFTDARLSFDKVMNLLDNDEQLASLAGLTAFVQAIDNSVVREGEMLKYQGANGMMTQLVNIINKSAGKDFDPATKQSIRNAAAALVNAEKGRATAITNSYQDRAISFGLDANKVLSGVDETLFTPIQIDRSAQVEAEAQADIAEAAQQTFVEFSESGEGVLSAISDATVGNIGEGFAILADKAVQVFQDGGRGLTGATLHIDPQTGTIWEQDSDGNWRRIAGTEDEKRQAELLRLRSTGARLTPELQKRQDDIDAQKRAVDRQPGLFQKGGFFDRQ